MGYPGFCDTYGPELVLPLAYFGPCAISYLFNTITGVPEHDIVVNAVTYLGASIAGINLSMLSHSIADSVLYRKRAGLTRGSNIIKSVQAGVYALPIAALMVFNLAVSGDYTDKVEPDKSNSVQTNNLKTTTPIPSSR